MEHFRKLDLRSDRPRRIAFDAATLAGPGPDVTGPRVHRLPGARQIAV